LETEKGVEIRKGQLTEETNVRRTGRTEGKSKTERCNRKSETILATIEWKQKEKIVRRRRGLAGTLDTMCTAKKKEMSRISDHVN